MLSGAVGWGGWGGEPQFRGMPPAAAAAAAAASLRTHSLRLYSSRGCR